MEDFPLPIHMHRKIGIGGVAIRDKKVTSSLIFQKTITSRPKGAKKNVLIRLSAYGTGFIVSKSKIFIGGVKKKLALVLTAGHVVCSVEDYKPYANTFNARIEDEGFGDAYFIKSFMTEYTNEFKSTFTDGYYCLPGDLAILLLDAKYGKIDNYRFAKASKIKPGIDCIVSGYPFKPHKVKYCIPQLEALNKSVIESEANSIFCNFNSKVYSSGNVENLNSGIIEVSCSTANGMSGSPIISDRKVIGVYVGGPPIPGQRECIMILQRLKRNDNPLEIFEDIRNLIAFDTFFIIPIFGEFFSGSIVQDFYLYGKAMIGGILTEKEKKDIAKIIDVPKEFNASVNTLSILIYNLIYTAVTEYRDKDKFQANIGLSVQHDAFQKGVLNIIDKFSYVSCAQTLEDLIDYLRV